ncbi:MAG: TetR/AcrR family transcriptional regulator [bacterium]|uniref:Transcriptional regulator n=2 Tax=Bacteria candidate phyla TaxID=1783234 RepID=A0A101I438_UNCT6|nr:MAG: Transcriptional regulator [candidate division TA06 bacterium 32_111]KUK88064.1 MAG: Transcriptional regulator [candidate division TA06 bacterium 34_109]MDI6700870.1 TetR/AcrR family transcriptional regulator [bacterium]HAF06996.1 TetR family transcriptional regulator [candidate division WOR-3 bacterium]HCP16910.1 TetR family transcriptional regulator [candidate division WOR-3 bacterium]
MAQLEKDVREIIIEAARNIFARFGFRKTTMDEIAQAALKAKSSIYHYFKSKDEIFRTIVEKESRTLREEIKKAIKQEDSPQKKLRAYVITRMHTLQCLANLYSAIKDEYLKQYGFIKKLRANHNKEEIRIMKEILKEGCDRGIFQIKDLDVTAITIITTLKGLEYSGINESDVSKTEKNIDSLLEILFNGIVKR